MGGWLACCRRCLGAHVALQRTTDVTDWCCAGICPPICPRGHGLRAQLLQPCAAPPQVRYVCNGGASMDSVISSIQEPSSCSYLITISTPRLCKHPDFRSVPPPVSAIKCIPHPTEGGVGPAASGGRQAAAGGQVVALPGGAEGQCRAGGECGGAAGGAAGGGGGTRQGRPGGSEAAEPPHAEPDVQQPANWTSPYDEDEVFLDAEEGWVEGVGGEAAMDPELYDAMYFAARDLGEEEDEYEDPDEGEDPAPSGATGQRDEL